MFDFTKIPRLQKGKAAITLQQFATRQKKKIF